MRYRFYVVDVFTDRAFAGNPLAVFPDARGLTPRQMQLVAREFNLSETAFVFPPETPGHTRRLRIFTPGTELPFAGHPTVGTAYLLASLGEIETRSGTTRIVLEEGVGPVEVALYSQEGSPLFVQLSAARPPEFGPPPPPVEAIAAVLSLDPADLLAGDLAPQAVSCGVPFLFVPVRDRAAIGRIRISLERWEQTLASYWAPHLYVFTTDTELPGTDLHARMFAPDMGLLEDPATGAAATALGGYLGVREPTASGTLRWVVEQGIEIERPSFLHVETEKRDGEIIAIRVGGTAVKISEGEMEIPPESASR